MSMEEDDDDEDDEEDSLVAMFVKNGALVSAFGSLWPSSKKGLTLFALTICELLLSLLILFPFSHFKYFKCSSIFLISLEQIISNLLSKKIRKTDMLISQYSVIILLYPNIGAKIMYLITKMFRENLTISLEFFNSMIGNKINIKKKKKRGEK